MAGHACCVVASVLFPSDGLSLRLAASSQHGAEGYLADSKMLFNGATRSGGISVVWAVPPRLPPEAVIMAAVRRARHPVRVKGGAVWPFFRKKPVTVAGR